MASSEQTLPICNLNVQTRSSIDLDDHGTQLDIEEDIHSHVTERNGVVTLRGHPKALPHPTHPMSPQQLMRVGMMGDGAVLPHAVGGLTAGQIDSQPDAPAVEVRAAFRLRRGYTGHCHYRAPLKHNHPEIRGPRAVG